MKKLVPLFERTIGEQLMKLLELLMRHMTHAMPFCMMTLTCILCVCVHVHVHVCALVCVSVRSASSPFSYSTFFLVMIP